MEEQCERAGEEQCERAGEEQCERAGEEETKAHWIKEQSMTIVRGIWVWPREITF